MLPPKMGEGVSGFNSGCTQTFFTGLAGAAGAGAAGAGATSAEARTDRRCTDAQGRIAALLRDTEDLRIIMVDILKVLVQNRC